MCVEGGGCGCLILEFKCGCKDEEKVCVHACVCVFACTCLCVCVCVHVCMVERREGADV